ncbi:MAG: 1-deoxy-D-xylulose-5-phosphate synthase [Elusimicrobiota bacterium]
MLENINSPQDVKQLDKSSLDELAVEVRNLIIETTARQGGHIAPSLGAVDLAIALHYVLNTPKDKLIWDVGHQAYAHKILTGRCKGFTKLRELDGISGFPKISESEYDAFGVGHSSTSISAALGMAAARDINGEDFKVTAVIGDGAMTAGMAYEGLNNAGHLKKDMLVVLNDNDMFISKKVGAMGEYLTKLLTFKPFQKFENKVKHTLNNHPKWGNEVMKMARRSKSFLTPGMVFEEMGFSYYGPVDGHNIEGLIDNMESLDNIEGPKLLHVITKKGKGYPPAEDNPEKFHGTGAFDIETGKSKSETTGPPKYQDVFGDTIVDLANKDENIVALTAAMESGTGLKKFAREFEDRFFDVGIAEQHEVTFAAGLAREGLKPVCAIYSSFLQRAYDQVIHDVALQELPVIFAIDRAGIVGEDGPTHHGVFDISYLSAVPNLTVVSPSDEVELKNLLYSALKWNTPTAIRYPRGRGEGADLTGEYELLKPGISEVLRSGEDLTIIGVGNMVGRAIEAAEILEEEKDIGAEVINLRFIKPMDIDTIRNSALKTGKVVTVEENSIAGSAGEKICRILPENIDVFNMAVPDRFITFGDARKLREKLGLTAQGIVRASGKIISE